MVTTEALERMTVALTTGRSFESAGVPDDSEHRAAWDRLSEEIAQLREQGIEVGVSPETPDVGGYDIASGTYEV